MSVAALVSGNGPVAVIDTPWARAQPTKFRADNLAMLHFQKLAAEIARAITKPFRGPGRNLQELVSIYIRLEPVDHDFELSIHLRLHLL